MSDVFGKVMMSIGNESAKFINQIKIDGNNDLLTDLVQFAVFRILLLKESAKTKHNLTNLTGLFDEAAVYMYDNPQHSFYECLELVQHARAVDGGLRNISVN